MGNTVIADLQSYLSKFDFLQDLAPEVIRELGTVCSIKLYKDGERVFSQGQHITSVFIILRGQLKVFRSDAKGRNQVLQFMKPEEIIGEVPTFDDQPIASSGEACGDTELLLIPCERLRALSKEFPQVSDAILRRFCSKLRHLVDLVQALSLHSVPQRVAQLILDEHEREPQKHFVEFQQNQEALAQQVGASREAVSRALRLLSDLGLIHNSFPVVRLLDVPKLKRYAKG